MALNLLAGLLGNSSAPANATNPTHNATAVAPPTAHVTHPYNGTGEMPDSVWGAFFEGLKLFGEAVAEQSELQEANNVRWDRFGSLAAYAFSVYGISTFLVALILNRTTVIASSASAMARDSRARGPLAVFRKSPVPQGVILALLRLSAVVLLASQGSNILAALSVVGQNHSTETVSRLTRWASQNFQYDPSVYALDQYMKMPRHEVRFGPTTDMLWPVFLSVSYSLFVETFAAAISQQKPFLEGGLTLFELSLAIQEMSSGFFFLRKYPIAKRPTEQVLVICIFSIADQIASQIGAVVYANKYRLIPSTLISSMFVWYFCTFIPGGGIFSLPSEIALTYFALVVTLGVTVACAFILVLTVVTKGARVDELNFANFFADDDPQNEIFSKYLGLDLSQDFYTAVINLGMVAVTQAGKASYFSAYNYVSSPRETWLEHSLWEQLKTAFDAKIPLSDDENQTHKILHFLREHHISGYNNIINKPSKRLINGSDSDGDHVKRVGSMYLRLAYLKETLLRFGQLALWAALQLMYYWPKGKLFGSSRTDREESSEAFEARKARAPSFVRHLLARNERAAIELNNSAGPRHERDSLEELPEDDDSPDFELIAYDEYADSEAESDAELIDLSNAPQTHIKSDSDHSEGYSSALSELMTADNIIELFEDKEILHEHLQYEHAEHGIMTRSRYRALHGEKSPRDQTAELLDLILSKRRAELKHGEKTSTDDDIDDIDPRIACVICQTEPRTLITWPCKCFAICEGCRVSLVGKGMKGCVCCRQDVEGVSRVYLP